MTLDPPDMLPAEDVATIIRRAELLGFPAWRVATALDLPVEPERLPPARPAGNAR
jgi:hypothetical protein